MEFGLSESQQLLKDNARKFFAGECPMEKARRLIDTADAFDSGLWSAMTEQGYTGIIFPEEFDGVGLGKVELAILMEEAGRAYLPGPLFSTIAVAGPVLDSCGSREQKQTYLAPICRGEARAALAFFEPNANWDVADLKLQATNNRLTGEKLFVLDAAVANFIVVAARNGVFVVRANSPGLSIEPLTAMDLSRKSYAVRFHNTPAEPLANPAGLGYALQIATVALAADMVGGMQRTLELSVDYAKMRKQFGKIIGSFQAVQHQCADMYLETESARSAAFYAAWAVDHSAPDAEVAVSIAKMYASDAARAVGNRGIQIHGGMGFTWENDIHLHYRRAKASETMFGDASFHRERIARLVIDAPASNAANASASSASAANFETQQTERVSR